MKSIEQRLVLAEGGDRRSKLALLAPLVNAEERTIVFCGKKHVAKWLKTQLEKQVDGVTAVELHGDRSQAHQTWIEREPSAAP